MKHNIIICRGTIQTINPEYIKKIKSAANIDKSYVVVGYINQIGLFEEDSYCFFRKDCIVGKYSKYVNELGLELKPLDTTVLSKIRLFFSEIMMIQRRFEERIPLRISSKLEDHYLLTMEHLLFWNSFLDSQSIDVAIFSDVPHEGYDNILYELCKIKGIKTILYRSLFKTNRFFVIDDYKDMTKTVAEKLIICKEKFARLDETEILLSPSVDDFYNALKQENKKSSLFREETSRSNEFRYRFGETNLFLFIRNICCKQQKSTSKKESLLSLYAHIRNYAFILKKRRATKQFVRQYDELSEMPSVHEKYVYYALHLLPECAVAPLGGLFSDQYLAIKMLSYCIPQDWKLYIKIHPAQVDMLMSIDEIKKYKQLKNVRIIAENANQYELIRNSMAVSTLTGEIAVEALFLDKPSIIFGYTYYSASPLAFTVGTEEELRIAMRKIQDNKFECSNRELKVYFKALEEATHEDMDKVISEIINKAM
jgi:hypothetical protein